MPFSDGGLDIEEALHAVSPQILIWNTDQCLRNWKLAQNGIEHFRGNGLESREDRIKRCRNSREVWQRYRDEQCLLLETELQTGRYIAKWADPQTPITEPAKLLAPDRCIGIRAWWIDPELRGIIKIGADYYFDVRFYASAAVSLPTPEAPDAQPPSPKKGKLPTAGQMAADAARDVALEAADKSAAGAVKPVMPKRRTALYLIAEKLFPEMETLISSGKCVGDSAEWQAAGLVAARAGGSDKGEVRQKRLHKWFKAWREEQEPYSKAL